MSDSKDELVNQVARLRFLARAGVWEQPSEQTREGIRAVCDAAEACAREKERADSMTADARVIAEYLVARLLEIQTFKSIHGVTVITEQKILVFCPTRSVTISTSVSQYP